MVIGEDIDHDSSWLINTHFRVDIKSRGSLCHFLFLFWCSPKQCHVWSLLIVRTQPPRRESFYLIDRFKPILASPGILHLKKNPDRINDRGFRINAWQKLAP